MRLLQDESLPRPFGRHLVSHDVVTVADAGWAGYTNGRLLTVAHHHFDCLVTMSRGLVH